MDLYVANDTFKYFILDWTSSSTTSVITIVSKYLFSMFVVEDLLPCGTLFAKFGPIFTKYFLKLFVILILFVVVCPLIAKVEHELDLTFFLFTIF